MRRFVLPIAFALAACGQPQQPPPLPEQNAAAAPPTWFICDAVNAPALISFEREGDVVRAALYEKPSGALAQRTEYRVGGEEGAAGSAYITLTQNGDEAGFVRRINPGVLETPGSAYTTPFTSVRLGEREISCRWLPRTRLFGFTGRRSFVVHEDADGDLIYTTYDFAAAEAARPVELSENARTTSFSVEVRGGEETMSPNGASYVFENQGYRYVVTVRRDGTGELAVARDGEAVQSEPLIAFVQGQGAE